jgi:ABC-type bacteriocin/lantibiotic exporter with double-glycine peptidase domain
MRRYRGQDGSVDCARRALGRHCLRRAGTGLRGRHRGARPANSRRGGAAARGISFRYSDNEPRIIADLDLDVAPGECVGLAGPSGAGKTTLIKILAGLLRLEAGIDYIDDVPLQAIGLDAYRSQIGCTSQPQDPVADASS